MYKNADGKFVVKGGIFLTYFWGRNFYRFLLGGLLIEDDEKKEPHFPKNICSLFWGSIFAPLWWLLSCTIAVPVYSVIAVFIVLFIAYIGLAFLFGFVIRSNADSKSGSRIFYPYRMYGEKGSKELPIVPWHILVPALVLWFIYRNFSTISDTTVTFVTSMVSFVFSSYMVAIIVTIIVLVLLILFFRSTAWRVSWEFAKATKKKMCPLIIVEKKG